MKMKKKIKNIQALEVLDSRGDPTIQTKVFLENGIYGKALVPSGASKGKHEALELRDNDPNRYQGKGVLKACSNVNKIIAQELKGKEVLKQEEIDQLLIDLDGTSNKSRLGANAILSVSLACARAAAKSENLKLYEYIAKLYGLKVQDYELPRPMFNIFNGGKHADTNLDFQEFMIVPLKFKPFKEAVRIASEIFHKLREVLLKKNLDTDVGNEGGFAPDVEYTTQAIEMILEAIDSAGYKPGKDIGLALDAGASTFYEEKEDKYVLGLEKLSLSSRQLMALYKEWIDKYYFISLEDPLNEEDWGGWKKITEELGDKVQIVGDDLFVTNIKRLERGIKEKAANAILIKLNQIGTLTETLKCIKRAKEAGFKTIISHRSGETCDTFIADLAVGTAAGQIKTGSVSRSERTAKYNRLIEIEEELK